MKIPDTSIPVVLLSCKLGALGVMRSLGGLGVSVYGVDPDSKAPGFLSRYCAKKFDKQIDENSPEEYLAYLISIGKEIGKRSVVIWTSDETGVFVAQNKSELSEYFLFPENDPDMIVRLMNKKGMYNLALQYDIPTPFTKFPQNVDDVKTYIEKAMFPLVIKGILGNRLYERTGKKMVIVQSEEEMLRFYDLLEDPDNPNLMLQECIPGGDDEVYIFNGYFDRNSECLSPFTGHKIRQFPVHVGCASLGACVWNKEVSDLTLRFMKEVSYQGILDIGYRLDPRDGKYKVLDVNPRIGQAFRMFVGQDNLDVARDLYLDLTGQPRVKSTPREGRLWMIEDYDLISSIDYIREGSLTISDWIGSFRRLEEAAWFHSKDLRPFFDMSIRLLKQIFYSILRKVGLSKSKA